MIANADAGAGQGGSFFGLPGWVYERRSEAETLERLMRDHETAIRRVAHAILMDPRDVEEAVSDTFRKALKGLGGYRKEASEQTWLRSICCNVCVDKRRRRRAVCAALDPDQEPPAGADDPELSVAVWQEIDDLPDNWRAAFTLWHAGFTFAQISKLLGKPRTTVSGHRDAACERLRERLAGHTRRVPTTQGRELTWDTTNAGRPSSRTSGPPR
ncbi:MAG: sigma-70 family RNA polymerase sigma factor [Actinomycetota bacterium]|nr:sigma-70 family RNA polymerase sigma factor [Actinomycetota bacterium]